MERSNRFEFEGTTWDLEAIKKALLSKTPPAIDMVDWDSTTQGYNFWFNWHYTGTNDAKARAYLRRVLDAAAASFDPLKPMRYRGQPDYEARLLASDLGGDRPLAFAVKRRGGSEECVIQRRADGRVDTDRKKDEDVVNYVPKKTGWLAHWKSGNERHTSQIYDTREEAELCTHVPGAVIVELPEYEP